MWPNYPGAEFVRKAFKFRQRKENSQPCVHVLQQPLNLPFHVVVVVVVVVIVVAVVVVVVVIVVFVCREWQRNVPKKCNAILQLTLKSYCFVTFLLQSPSGLVRFLLHDTTTNRTKGFNK